MNHSKICAFKIYPSLIKWKTFRMKLFESHFPFRQHFAKLCCTLLYLRDNSSIVCQLQTDCKWISISTLSLKLAKWASYLWSSVTMLRILPRVPITAVRRVRIPETKYFRDGKISNSVSDGKPHLVFIVAEIEFVNRTESSVWI